MRDSRWPELPYDAWRDTYATLHMWMQVAGKVVLATAPPLNHSWGLTFRVTPRGLASRMLVRGPHAFTLAFDFIDHRFVVHTDDGEEGALPLRAQSVADFHRDARQLLHDMDLDVKFWPMPVEVADPVRFDENTAPGTYDGAAVRRFHEILVRVHRVFELSRCSFLGKSSPAQFFWGSFDLAVTRFSGRLAPPREGPAFMREAYSHEVISHGFWPGSGPVTEAAFYAYAVPEPAGFRQAGVRPGAAYYQDTLHEYVLPYEAVRLAADPEAEIRAFLETTYAAGADLGGWDRAALERDVRDAA